MRFSDRYNQSGTQHNQEVAIMCNPASFVATKDRVYWSKKTDSHHEIISEHGLCESGIRGVNVVPLEITPEGGNLSLPLKDWKFAIDFAGFPRDLPEWWDLGKYEAMTRAELKGWAKVKLKGWKVKEAFNPVNPLKQKRDKSLDKVALLKNWDSVQNSVQNSVRNSVHDSVHDSVQNSVWVSVQNSVWDSVRVSVRVSLQNSVWVSVQDSVRVSLRVSLRDSVRDSVWASVGDSVWAYIGSLFHNITNWKYCSKDKKRPWHSLRKLWLGGYVPSFDGKIWRLHAGLKAEIVFEISAEELRKN